jgi:hypothetical protein
MCGKLLPAVVTVVGLVAATQRPAFADSAAAPPDLSRWGLHCFCLSARHPPHGIVQADTNGRVLWRARDGSTVAAVREAGIRIDDSQLLLLRTYGLIREDDGHIKTAFPVLGPEVMEPLRARIQSLANLLLPEIARPSKAIVTALQREGSGGHGFAVVFGYALDGLVWDELRRLGELPDTTLDLDHPFWRGAFWAVFPERAGVPGTNEVQLQGRTLVAVWTDRTAAAVNEYLRSTSRGEGADGSAQSASLSTLPRLHDSVEDPTRKQAQLISGTVADALLRGSAGRDVLRLVPDADTNQAVVIVTHELIWDLIDGLVREGVVAKPRALTVEQPSPEEVKELLFLRDVA